MGQLRVKRLLLLWLQLFSISKALTTDDMKNLTESQNGQFTFLVMADLHSFTKVILPDVDLDVWKNTTTSILENIKNSFAPDGEIVLVPGDYASFGRLSNKYIAEVMGTSNENEAVYEASLATAKTMMQAFDMTGFTKVLPCLGDHELGGNMGFVVGRTTSKVDSIPFYFRGFADALMMKVNAETLEFTDSINDATSSVREAGFEKSTSYAYRYKNTMFISVNMFTTMNEGKTNYMIRTNGVGGEGTVTCSVKSKDLKWFENVLKSSRNDSTIRHIFVQGHVPIQHPVRKTRSSGQFFDEGVDSKFWKLMEKYEVDIYFGGEVHSNTVTRSKKKGSNLLQIMSRSNRFSGFLTVEVKNEVIEIRSLNEVGKGWRWNNNYEQNGSVRIDKTDIKNVQINSYGELKELNDNEAVIYFDFEGVHSISERQVFEMYDKQKNLLVTDSQLIGGANATKCFHNQGSFGQQYDAQIHSVKLVKSRSGRGFAGKFTAESRMGIFGVGPFTAGLAHSISLWIKTDEVSKAMILVYYGPEHKVWRKDTLLLMLRKGRVELQLSPKSLLKSSTSPMIADNLWHHIVLTMPKDSCAPSELRLYIDGNEFYFDSNLKKNSSIFFHTAGRMNFGSFGYAQSTIGNVGNFEGVFDDIMVWTRPLQLDDIQRLNCRDDMEFRFNTQKKRVRQCKWLDLQKKRDEYCKLTEVKVNCRASCGLCMKLLLA